ncbi:KH domain-containing protein HEN4-like isoform X3 [Glycine soja]|uniref:KH domain-containing protein HEN4-like isoform X3 n=1 Tax=Glycine soja TaxID=3848 RepID=UPI00103AD690|nr:KH domain-containing protein HEN4-like isoform X3 [Glycine soja]
MGSNFLSPPAKRSAPDPYPFPPNGPSKRSRQSKPPPPLSVPPGHVAFRLLCNASRIGGVIGKSGSVIKTLQQSTGAKIRIEDAPQELPDRIILVIADAALSGKILLRNEEVIEVSKAQEALLKVFDRILEVAAETEGVDVGDRVMSCRLVADAAQAGSVIGKGGKVVERIKKETGCKIRVLTDDLPLCASASDEIIEIEGRVSSVKKALVAVSQRLQDCHPVDRTKMMGSKPYEIVQYEALDALPRATSTAAPRVTLTAAPRGTLTAVQHETVDHLLLRSSALSTLSSSSNSYATRIHSLPTEVNRVSSLEPKALKQEVTFRILCSNDRVGGVIGKGGNIVRALQSETGATISIGPAVAECEDRLITIAASENPESRYSPAQKAAVLVFSRSIEVGFEKGLDSGLNKGSIVTVRLVVPSSQVGCLIGKGGVIVSEMRKATGANIRIIGTDQVPKCASDNDQVVQISGEFSSVQDALYNAMGRLRDNLFVSTQNSAGTRSLSSLRVDTSPYGRQQDVVPLGSQLPPATSHSLSRHTFAQGIDHLGLSRNLDRPSSPGLWTRNLDRPSSPGLWTRNLDRPSSPGLWTRNLDRPSSPGLWTRNLDRPSSPGLWAPPTVAGINSRGINDFSLGLTSRKGGLELVSGSKSAIVTNTIVEIVVPDDTIDCVYGENGSNLARLRQISGANVVVHEPRPGTSDRIIVISGTPDETQAAQSLLQAFILSGS